MKYTILIIEDEKLVRWSLKEQLAKKGYQILEAENGTDGQKSFHEVEPDVVLLDVKLPDANGLDLLSGFQNLRAEIPVIIMTGHGNVEMAIEAMKRGAVNYIDKPFNIDELEIKIAQALDASALSRELKYLRQKNVEDKGFENIVAVSPSMTEVMSLVKQVSSGPLTTVLLQGESGTGKDVIAHCLHSHSVRSDKPFMNITCSALADTLLESELFGHEKGAFTDAHSTKKGLFEMADGGTVFLDEIGETSLAFQAKLLRFLEEKTFKRVGGTADIAVDVRVIAATNRDLVAEVEEGRFREDLFYRLNVINFSLDPLRERREDIVPLAQHFISNFNRDFKRHVKGLSKEAQSLLAEHGWPGNVRELKNCVERAMIFCKGDMVEADHLSFGQKLPHMNAGAAVKIPSGGLDFEEDVERKYIVEALRMVGGNHTRAGKLLGMNRDQIRYRIKKFNLDIQEMKTALS